MNRIRRPFGIACLALAVSISAFALEQWKQWKAPRVLQPVGELVEVDGRRSHIVCAGSGSPTVVLEAGLDPWGALSWARVQPEISNITRVCAYDRAGIAWSEPRGEKRDASRIAEELHKLLRAKSESPPYVLVGHSQGGTYARVFAGRYRKEVVGFVFIDSSTPRQDESLPQPAWAGAMIWLSRGLSETGLDRLRGLGGMPWLAESQRDALQALAPGSTRAIHHELRAISESSDQDEATASLGDRPLVVLTAGESVRRTPAWYALQAQLAGRSTNSDHRIIHGADHYIQNDRPESVIAAIAEVVHAVRVPCATSRLGSQAGNAGDRGAAGRRTRASNTTIPAS